MIARRTFIERASLAIASAAPGIFVGVSQAQQVPNSSGSEPAKLKASAGACDCHHHIYDAVRASMRPSRRPCLCRTGLCPTEENALTVGAVYDRPFFLDSTKYGRS